MSPLDPRRKYVVAGGGHHAVPRRVTHIIARQVDHLPNGYLCACAHFLRGRAVIGPSPEHPLCERCRVAVNGERHS